VFLADAVEQVPWQSIFKLAAEDHPVQMGQVVALEQLVDSANLLQQSLLVVLVGGSFCYAWEALGSDSRVALLHNKIKVGIGLSKLPTGP
jgi:hypothetical protein